MSTNQSLQVCEPRRHSRFAFARRPATPKMLPEPRSPEARSPALTTAPSPVSHQTRLESRSSSQSSLEGVCDPNSVSGASERIAVEPVKPKQQPDKPKPEPVPPQSAANRLPECVCADEAAACRCLRAVWIVLRSIDAEAHFGAFASEEVDMPAGSRLEAGARCGMH